MDSTLIFRFLCSLQAVSLAGSLAIHGSKTSSYLFLYWGLPEPLSIYVDYIVIAFLILAAICVFLFKRIFLSFLIVGATAFAEALFYSAGGGGFASDWTLLSDLSRWAWPFLIIFCKYDFSSKLLLSPKLCRFLLGALAVTYCVHGMKAIYLNPGFLNLIYSFLVAIGSGDVRQDNIEYLLISIGLLDVFVAISLIFFPSRLLLHWVVFWSLVTASSRTFLLGSLGLVELGLRAPHYLIPLILLLEKVYKEPFKLVLSNKKTVDV